MCANEATLVNYGRHINIIERGIMQQQRDEQQLVSQATQVSALFVLLY